MKYFIQSYYFSHAGSHSVVLLTKILMDATKKKKKGLGNNQVYQEFILVLTEVLRINLGFLPTCLEDQKIPSFSLALYFHHTHKKLLFKNYNPQ